MKRFPYIPVACPRRIASVLAPSLDSALISRSNEALTSEWNRSQIHGQGKDCTKPAALLDCTLSCGDFKVPA